MNLNLYMPTKVIVDDECILKNKKILGSFGRRALIVTGTNSAKKNGSLQDVKKALDSLGLEYSIYDKVMTNPTVACAYEGAAFAKKEKADFIIGIGGGSPMDAAKAMAILAVQDIKESELFQTALGDRALPTVMIPTTAGTGSEVTRNAILTSDALQTKRSIAAPCMFPKLALLDAKYMKDLPQAITINTALDALSHSIEGMLSKNASIFSDFIAMESIKILSACIKKLSSDGQMNLNPDIRQKLLYGSMLAGIVISHTGTTAVHAMGYSLTYYKNIDHGRANALLLPGFMSFIEKGEPDLVKKILGCMGLESVDAFKALISRLLGTPDIISIEEVSKFTDIACEAKSIKNTRLIPSKEDIFNLFMQ